MIKAVISDCFGVLYVPLHRYEYQSLLLNPTVHHDEIRDLVRQAEYGFISDEELYEGMAHYTGLSLHEIHRNLKDGFVRNSELLGYLQGLRPERKVGLLTNLGRNRIDDFFAPGEQAELFDEVVVSSDVGMIKPNPGIYDYICQKLGVATSEAVMIDDVEDNCTGARQAGLCAIRYDSVSQVQHDLGRVFREQG